MKFLNLDKCSTDHTTIEIMTEECAKHTLVWSRIREDGEDH